MAEPVAAGLAHWCAQGTDRPLALLGVPGVSGVPDAAATNPPTGTSADATTTGTATADTANIGNADIGRRLADTSART